MDYIIYLVAYPIIWLLSVLPFRLLYCVSDVLYFVMYVLLKYRVKVVRKNLHTAFPFKTTEELSVIERKFYHHF